MMRSIRIKPYRSHPIVWPHFSTYMLSLDTYIRYPISMINLLSNLYIVDYEYDSSAIVITLYSSNTVRF
jgi:hypothetical protein